MNEPFSHFFEGTPRLHYLEWNPRGRATVVLLHGSSANAWWWQPLAAALAKIDASRYRLVALDLRGHGDSAWVRPPAYVPDDYARDLARFLRAKGYIRPIVAGHSMGGIATLAFAAEYPSLARAAIAIDVAISSTPPRDRLMKRLGKLPVVNYPDRATALARFRLMPDEGAIAPEVLAEVAAYSIERTDDGRFTLKFDRASFIGGDGIDVRAAIARLRTPTLLVRAEKSRIMTAEATALAAAANPLVSVAMIPGAHHHVPLESPDPLAQVIDRFATGVE